MFKQTNNGSPERSNWLDTVARAAIDVFNVPPCDDNASNSGLNNDNNSVENDGSSMWLVAPLVSKLPSAIQGRILRVAGQVLEATNFFNSATKMKEELNEDSNESNDQMERMKPETPQMSYQAFLGLILTCLKGQDEQKEGLLSSLYSQLSQFLQHVNDVMVNIDKCGSTKIRTSKLNTSVCSFRKWAVFRILLDVKRCWMHCNCDSH